MRFRALKYLLAFVLPLFVAQAFLTTGWLTFTPLLYAFGLIPLLELLFVPDKENLLAAQAEIVREDKLYDALLYLTLPVQYGFLCWFLFNIGTVEAFSLSFWGRSLGMGLLCGVLGINVAHELGHRREKAAQKVAKALLLTSLYPHFYIEHNFGHHKNVSTPQDPASSRYNEVLYAFWIRSIAFSYLSAWRIQMGLLKRQKRSFFSYRNDMFWYAVCTILLLVLIYIAFGLAALWGFLISATFGILLLETVNYIEHYGLQRKKVSDKRYEQTTPLHSWNSNHLVGRLVLFELSRHSDHHANPHKKYQVLNHHEQSPQMPTGYPGMMLLAALPPLWFGIMNKRLHRLLER